MKRKVLIGMALLLVVPLLASCGGVAQEDLDAAVAAKEAAEAQVASLQSQLGAAQSDLDAAESDLAAAESDLATAQGDLSSAQSAKATAQSALAAAETEIADLEAQIAELEVAEEEEEEVAEEEEEEEAVTGLSFTPATYTNADYGFSLQYPDTWTEKTDDAAEGVIWRFGDPATYSVPTVKVIVRDEADGATLQEVYAKVLESDGKAITTFTASDVTINDTDFSKGEVVCSSAYGDYDSIVIGLVKDGKWVIIEVYEMPGLGAVWPNETMKAEIIGTVTFE